MEINWTVLVYIFIGLFALSGFFKGWWKEAITTYFLLLLVFLLYFPFLAQLFIAAINFVFALIASVLPDAWKITLSYWLETGLGVRTVDGAIQLDPNNGGTWLVLLLISIGLALFIGRFLLPSDFRLGVSEIYVPRLLASLLGALIGAFNGFLIVSLIGAYVGSGLTLEAATTTGTLQAVAVPGFTLTASLIPWVFILISVLVLVLALGTRVTVKRDKEGYVKVDWVNPVGHRKYEVTTK